MVGIVEAHSARRDMQEGRHDDAGVRATVDPFVSGNGLMRSVTRRSLVQPASSMTGSRSAAVVTVSNRPIGGNRDGMRRWAGTARQRTVRSREGGVRVVVRPKTDVDCIGRHVDSAAGRIEETPDGQQSVLAAAGNKLHGRADAEHRRLVRSSQPGEALLLSALQHAQRLVNAKNHRNPGEHIAGSAWCRGR